MQNRAGRFVFLLVFILAGSAAAERPEIGYVSRGAANYSPILIFGEGFEAKRTDFFGLTPKQDLTPEQMIGRIGQAEWAPPREPPGGLRPMQVLATDAQVAAVVLYGGGHPGGVKSPHFIWAKNKEGCSQPYVINRPELFFLERETAAPGEELRVIGRDMISSQHGLWGGVFLRDPRSGKTWTTRWGKYFDVQNHFNHQLDFEIVFQVPTEVPEGRYQVWVHSGTGGWFGWCTEPLELTVTRPKAEQRPALAITDFGAKGDGTTDCTAAIQAAIEAARKAGGGRVRVPMGVFVVSGPLWLPEGVELVGLGPDRSAIHATTDCTLGEVPLEKRWPAASRAQLDAFRLAKSKAMIWVSSRSGVYDLELRGCGADQLLHSGAGRLELCDFTLARCRLVNPGSALFVTAPIHQRGRGCLAGGNPWRRVRVIENEMKAMAGCGTYGEIRDCRVSGNEFEPAGGPFGTTGFSTLNGWHNIVEGNIIRNSNRGFTGGPWQQKNQGQNLIARNQIVEGGMNQGAAESLLVEFGGGAADGWYGRVAAAGPDWFEGFAGAAGRDYLDPPLAADAYNSRADTPRAKYVAGKHEGLFAIVVKGRGLGQFRRVAGNTEHRVQLEKAWRIVPDSSSWIIVRRMYYSGIFLNNVGRDTLGALELWGGALENVVRRHTAIRTGPVYAMTDSTPGVMHNRFEACQLYGAVLALWETHRYDHAFRAPSIVGNIMTGNQVEEGSILLVRKAYGKRGYVGLDDAAVVADGPAIAYNAFGGNTIVPKSDQPAIHLIDRSCVGNVFWRNSYPFSRVVDQGASTTWADNIDGIRTHLKDAFQYEAPARKAK